MASDQSSIVSLIVPDKAPNFGWVCSYCSFRERCGQTDQPYADAPAEGFLPLTRYPREQVTAALEAESGAAALTPTLAHQYSELASEHAVADWQYSVWEQRSGGRLSSGTGPSRRRRTVRHVQQLDGRLRSVGRCWGKGVTMAEAPHADEQTEIAVGR